MTIQRGYGFALDGWQHDMQQMGFNLRSECIDGY